MLIDTFLPLYHAVERHNVVVAAQPEAALRAIWEVDLADSLVIRWLFRLRGLPSRSVRLGDLERLGFARLAEDPGREILYGLIGRFWTPSGGMVATDAEHFASFGDPGYAKAAWNFTVAPTGVGGSAVLGTETRVACTDRRSRRRFGLYWTVVGPFSAWTRREMLRLARNAAESAS